MRSPAGGDTPSVDVVSCGLPLPGHEVRIVGADGRMLPERRIGQLEFRGPSATAGYFRNPAADAALFHDGWLDTGDFAYLVDGELYVTGRAKDMIIRGGRNFYPYELEQAVGELPGVRKGCVAAFGVPDAAPAGERLVVVAEMREKDAAARQALEQRIVAVSSDVLGLPADEVVLVPPHAVLKTSSGKIRRGAIREGYRHGTLGTGNRPRWVQVLRMAASGARARAGAAASGIAALVHGAWVWAWLAVLGGCAAVAVLLLPTLAQRWACCHALARLFGHLGGCPVEVSGLDSLPSGHCVFVANHASYVDGIILTAALPRPVAFVVKAELQRNRVLHVLLGRLGARFVERFDSRRSVEDARALGEAARKSPPLLFFAEGTIRREAGLLPFRLGAFQVAAQSNLPIVPLALMGTRDVLPSDSWLPRRGHRPRRRGRWGG